MSTQPTQPSKFTTATAKANSDEKPLRNVLLELHLVDVHILQQSMMYFLRHAPTPFDMGKYRDRSEYREVVRTLLEAMKSMDPEWFQSMHDGDTNPALPPGKPSQPPPPYDRRHLHPDDPRRRRNLFNQAPEPFA